MGSPKAGRSKASQLGGIWRRRIGAPFAALLVAAVLVLVLFTGHFAQGPDASSRFTPVHVDDSSPRTVRDRPVSSTDQDLDTSDSSKQQGETSDSSKQEGEGSDQKIELDESSMEAMEEQKQPREDTPGSAPYTKCTPPSNSTVCDLSNRDYTKFMTSC